MALSKLKPSSFADAVEGNPSLIINGDMAVAQRGTSVTAKTNTAYHTVDRFVTETNGATYDQSQSTTVPSGQGFSYSLKAVIDGAFTPTAAQYFIPFEQRIEGQNLQHLAYGTSNAKSVTLSFWIRSSKTGTYVVEFSNFNSTQVRKYSKQYTIDSADTWEYKTLTWEGDTVRSFDNNNGIEAAFYWWATAGTDFTSGTIPSGWENSTTANRAVGVPTSLADNDEFYLTGVKLEVGTTATPFKHESYEENLNKCQRYYYRIRAEANYQRYMHTQSVSTTNAQGTLTLPTEMRALPTIDTTGTASHYAFYRNNAVSVCTVAPLIGSSGSNNQSVNISGTTSAVLTAGESGDLIANNNTSVFLGFNAEL